MTESPLITIATICYNAAECIAPTMESVAAQSFKDFEHLIIDGASTDETLAVVHALGSRSLRILSERDNGIYDAMNKALAMARGRYIIFLNAGDAFHAPDTLQAYADAAKKHDADIIYADTVIVDADRKVLKPRHLSAPDKLTFKSFSDGMLVCHQAFMVKTSIAPKYDTSFRFSADYDWTIRCIRASRPEHRVNLRMVAIDYLTAGTTDKNHLKSLIERYKVMAAHYGIPTAVAKHISFIPRALIRKITGK